MHHNKFLYNKTNQMHQFPKFTPAWNSTCFGQFLCPLSGVYSLYTRHWYMSYSFEDSFRAEPGCCECCVLSETSDNTQHSQQTDHAPSGTRTRNPSKLGAPYTRLRPRAH